MVLEGAEVFGVAGVVVTVSVIVEAEEVVKTLVGTSVVEAFVAEGTSMERVGCVVRGEV